MGTQSSLPERPSSFRSPSPMAAATGYVDGDDDGFDGLPRVSSTLPDLAADHADLPDGLHRFATQPKPDKKKKKKKRKSLVRSPPQPAEEQDAQYTDPSGDAILKEYEEVSKLERRSSDIRREGEGGSGFMPINQTAAAQPRSMDQEPEPPSSKKHKKRSRTSKGKATGDELVQPLTPDHASASHNSTHGSALPEAGGAAELATPTPTERTPSSKKQKKDKRDKAKEKTLDLKEDPIAGSDQEGAVPSSTPRKRPSIAGIDSGSSRKKHKKWRMSSPIDPVEEFEPAQNTAKLEHDDIIESTQGAIAPMSRGYGNSKVHDATLERKLPQADDADPHNPDNHVHENGEHGRSQSPPALDFPQTASQRLGVRISQRKPPISEAYIIESEPSSDGEIKGARSELGDDEVQRNTEQPDADLDGDDMDVDEQPPGSGEDLGVQAVGQDSGNDRSVSDADEDMPVSAITSAQHQADEDHSMLSPSSVEDERNEDQHPDASETRADLNGNGINTASGSHKISQQITNFGSPRKRTNKVNGASENADSVADEPSSGDEQVDPTTGSDRAESDMGEPMSKNGADKESGEAGDATDDAQGEGSPTGRYPSTPSGHNTTSTLPTPGSKRSRGYARRRPKLSFFDRQADENVQAFAELPSNETPAPSRTLRPKRRLPVDVTADAGPSSSAPKKAKKSKKSAKARRGSENIEQDDQEVPLDGRYRRGALVQSEIAQVTGAIEEFRMEHQMNQFDLNVLIHTNPKYRKGMPQDLWSRVENACPTRPRGKLMAWSRHQFHNFVGRGKWTEEQDDELRQMVRMHGKKWAVIGKLINRHQDDIRDRWRNYLVCSDNLKTMHWSDDETTKFIGIVTESLLVAEKMREEDPDNESLRALSNEELIDWGFVSEKMDFTRNRLQCQEKWKRLRNTNKLDKKVSSLLASGSAWRLSQARKELREMPPKERYRLAQRVLGSGARKDSKIPWETVVKQFRGRFQRQTLIDAWAQLKLAVPDAEVSTTRDCAQHLVDMFEAQAEIAVAAEGDGADELQEPAIAKAPKPASTAKGKRKRTADADYDVVPESEPEEEPNSGGDSSRANRNEDSEPERSTSPGAESPDEEGERERTPMPRSQRLGDERNERHGSVDLSMDVDMDVDQDQAGPSSSRKASSGTAKSTRRKSTNKTSTLTPNSPESRKRSRVEHSPRSARKKKKARRDRHNPDAQPGSADEERDAEENGPPSVVSSSMSDMEDIPARARVAGRDEE